MTNPLLAHAILPSFATITPEHAEPALDHILADNRAQLAARLAEAVAPTWDNLVQLNERLENRLSAMWSIVSHLKQVVSTPAWRAAHAACLPKLTAYYTEMGQNEQLYAAYTALASRADYPQLSPARRKVVDDALRDFKLAGVHLPAAEKVTFAHLQEQLSQYCTTFAEHVLDATDAWSMTITDRSQLAGLPALALEQAAARAEADGEAGWRFTLDFPSYHAVMTYIKDRALREKVYRAYVTRASEFGDAAHDNSEIMASIMTTRQQLATLLGFQHYADYSLATKMARNTDDVLSFLADLKQQALQQAQIEFKALVTFAQEKDDLVNLQPWDFNYYSEKMRQDLYDLSEEALRPYFPVQRVLKGMFTLVHKLYGIEIEAIHTFEAWHDDVQLFQVRNRDGSEQGYFYIDLYARAQKAGGAWMGDCRERFRDGDQSLQQPVAYLICNFSPPTAQTPALLTYTDVETLFHEFGHTLHHLLTRVDERSVSGINGVAWDAVELPSQFMENWCWQENIVAMISGHYQTGEALPHAWFEKLQATRHFQAALQILRQLEFATFDFHLHLATETVDQNTIQAILDDARKDAVIPVATYNRFQHGFTHIFAGGYAAGYYSYLWAEVLSSDAFSRFEEEGFFNTAVGQQFLQHILEKGGTADPLDLFVAFRGREPNLDAFLRHRGMK